MVCCGINSTRKAVNWTMLQLLSALLVLLILNNQKYHAIHLLILQLYYLYSSLITRVLRRRAWGRNYSKDMPTFRVIDTLALYSLLTPALGCTSTQRYSNSMNTVVLQLSMCQTFTLLNNFDTVTGPLSQHTASTCTFEDTKTLCSILLLFCQQVLIEKHNSCSHSGLKMFSTANSTNTVALIHWYKAGM